MTLLQRVAAYLGHHQVPHALIGALGLAHAGIARSTLDADLLTCDTRVLEPAFWHAEGDAGYVIDCRRGDSQDPLAGVVRLETPEPEMVDVVVGRHPWQARAVDRARMVPGFPPVVLPSDLVLLKLYAGGTQDIWDIRELLTLPEAAVIAADVERDLVSMPSGMQRLWASLR